MCLLYVWWGFNEVQRMRADPAPPWFSWIDFMVSMGHKSTRGLDVPCRAALEY